MIDLSGIDVMDMLDRLGMANVRMTSGGQEVTYSCFGGEHSHGDDSPSAYMNVDSTAFFCHGCHMRGNAVHFVMAVQQVSQPTAENWLRDTYGIVFNEPLGGSMVAEIEARLRPAAEVPTLTPPDESWLRSMLFDWGTEPLGDPHHYMLDRGFSMTALNDWEIGYDFMSDRIGITVRNLEGKLVGVKGRAWDSREPKYLILGDRSVPRYGFQPYEASEVVFGLHRAREHKTAVLCEGELNAIALSQMGVERPIASGMSYFSPRHAQLVIREAERCVVFYDFGKAGSEGIWGHTAANGKYRPGVARLLEPYMPVLVVNTPPEDPAELLRQGRAEEALELVGGARSTMDLQTVFR